MHSAIFRGVIVVSICFFEFIDTVCFKVKPTDPNLLDRKAVQKGEIEKSSMADQVWREKLSNYISNMKFK